MPADRERNIHQLDLERRSLTARLDHGAYRDRPAEVEAALRRIDDLDLAIAAKPAEDVEALLVKVERLARIIMPDLECRPADSIEAVYMQAILNDLRRLARAAKNGGV